jgi:hypothetical protein
MQKYLQTYKASYKHICEEFKTFFIGEFLKHHWATVWYKFQDKLFYDKLTRNERLQKKVIAFKKDFSGVYSCEGNDSGTCTKPKNAYQEVFVASFAKQKENGTWYQHNEAWSMWSFADKPCQRPNYVFDSTASNHIIRKYKEQWIEEGKGDLEEVYDQSDGCAEQYKSKHTKFESTLVCSKFNLKSLISTHATTANFKGCVDSTGSDTKVWLRKQVRTLSLTITDAWEVFKHIQRMPQPAEDFVSEKGEPKQWKIHKRYHRFLCTQQQFDNHPEIRNYQDQAKIIIFEAPAGDKKNRDIPGIRTLYQFGSFLTDGNTRTIHYREFPCFCDACINKDYVNCCKRDLTTWKKKALLKRTRTVQTPSIQVETGQTQSAENASLHQGI